MSDEAGSCEHVARGVLVAARSRGCEECLASGSKWVHLRACTTCGHVGCCDQSPNRHARAHFVSTAHPAIQSAEPDERWLYCFDDDVFADPG